MEKRSITGKDILRMDGLLPPTRRLPVCDAVTSSDKKKEKKWSLGGILKRISSIRDYDSSSNDEEMVYCTRQPRPHSVFNRKSHSVTLHPVKRNTDKHLSKGSSSNSTVATSVDTTDLQRNSMHSRSSEGSLDRVSKKLRKSVLKARIEAKRDRICADSSSDDDSRISCNSLTRIQNESSTQYTQKSNSCNRKSRTARTERYIKRLSKDEGHRFSENPNNVSKSSSLDLADANQSLDIDPTNLFQSQVQPRPIMHPNSYTFPVQRSGENVQLAACSYQTKSSTDITKYPPNRYITDLNQNNTYAKPHVLHKDKNYTNHAECNYFSTSPATNNDYAKPYDYVRNAQSVYRSSCPPEPPPRDPRCKVFAYGCNSFPHSGKYRIPRYNESQHTNVYESHATSRDHLKGLRSYDSNNEIRWCGSTRHCPRRPLSLTVMPTESCNLSECTNNRHKSMGRHVDEMMFLETEAMKCERRNNRNEQLNLRFNDPDPKKDENKLSPTSAQNIYNNSAFTRNKTLDSPGVKSPSEQTVHERSYHSPNNTLVQNPRIEKRKEKQSTVSEQDVLEKRRSSKNLEEALSELEAIYNSLCLGDEDLLDRAERRSMEEFSLRRGRTDDAVSLDLVDSPDRSKDDMAYRRMHPKERPASLSEVIGQSALSNISYLMASPILSRKDAADNYPYASNYPVRKDVPDVQRDDVVYRSIHYANNTLKVADPQPPFGIPLGPVTAATESDYLHTTPTRPDHPRSSYIPQCEPDIVTDDLAYRTLRKDANTGKSAAESKSGVAKDQETTFGIKKKRAVRSLSANLYGLINHDRIHLRREPSLQEIKDETSNGVIDIKSLPARSNCFRRVVSDGELSDYDTRWRTESSLKNKKTDINGNHPISNISRKKLRVYVSPSTKIQSFDKASEEDTGAQNSATSNGILSQALNNDFWQDCLQTKLNESSTNDTESDFTAYSNLCQDLVNLIEGENKVEIEPSKETADFNSEEATAVKNLDDTNKTDDSSVLHIQTLGSQYSEHSEKNYEEITENGDVERLTESVANPENEDLEKTDDNAFDLYLRVADENVKLIAEAFSSVADRLRDSRVSQKNSLTSQRSEIETDSTAPNTSTRSSVTYSPDDVNDGLCYSSKFTDVSHAVPKENTPVNIVWDPEEVESEVAKNNSDIDPELDLSKAVHDLQLAAASLCEHKKEIEELEALWKKDANDVPCTAPVAITENRPLLTPEKTCSLENEDGQLECDQEESVISTDVKSWTDEHDPECEGESTECKNICGPHDNEIARSTGMRVSYVTNLITVMITTYSMVLLACFLALLLATVAAL
ncbi:PREDICTED: uncharacterized protein LOC107191815 [Dufourea novaeangliae]|uniref:Uncharacterized protein n=1 Tax=Dufourea novaeangliae TaxID=178035 RepID=A0A154PNY4_DUFNO|nr:PREDICTED: uncharacterized protein LOC107191815 [Dufourea novaeangliae]KZC13596.1 hypothetical protein WN55_05148 [Dufourea novaeangliae]